MLKRLHGSGWLDSVKLWVSISDFMRDKFIEAGIPKDRIVTLKHSWDALPAKPDTVDDGYYLFLGRLVPEKGIRVMLDAWRMLAEQMGNRTPKLIIAGSGSEEILVQSEAEGNKYVEYVGYVDGGEKTQLIAHCRAMLAPSVWWEPLGLVTYEAYDYAKPMLAAASGGLAETVQDGRTGFIFEPRDTESMCEAVQNIESLTAENRARMGEEGRKWLLYNTSPQVWKSRFNKCVENLF
jgi:glycosyltransferase involved in cell wall biosynthesis